jgi:hypothetical protein
MQSEAFLNEFCKYLVWKSQRHLGAILNTRFFAQILSEAKQRFNYCAGAVSLANHAYGKLVQFWLALQLAR